MRPWGPKGLWGGGGGGGGGGTRGARGRGVGRGRVEGRAQRPAPHLAQRAHALDAAPRAQAGRAEAVAAVEHDRGLQRVGEACSGGGVQWCGRAGGACTPQCGAHRNSARRAPRPPAATPFRPCGSSHMGHVSSGSYSGSSPLELALMAREGPPARLSDQVCGMEPSALGLAVDANEPATRKEAAPMLPGRASLRWLPRAARATWRVPPPAPLAFVRRPPPPHKMFFF